MRLMTRAFSLKFSWVGFKKRKKLALLPSACLFSVVSSPAFYGGWGIEGGLGPLGVAGETGQPRTQRRARKNKCESAKCVVGVPVRRSVVWSFIRPFARSFSYSRRAIKITRFAGRNAGAAPGGLNPSSLYESMACRQREAKTVSGSGGK